jgi:hypothetical protein
MLSRKKAASVAENGPISPIYSLNLTSKSIGSKAKKLDFMLNPQA